LGNVHDEGIAACQLGHGHHWSKLKNGI
jgi:hypothetical protein